MGRTFAESFLAAHVLRPKDLIILENDPTKVVSLREKNLGTIRDTPNKYIHEVDLIVLAIKPQGTAALYPTIRPFIKPDQVVLSIMAGVKISNIATNLGVSKVIRAMPNLPAQVGMGMTAFTAEKSVTRRELIEVQNLLSTTGRAIYFDDEQMIDAATAVSGSGPAYVFYFMQSMIEAAMNLGFNESQAELLVWQTFMGAMYLHNKNPLTCQEWIQRVASKGGTTEAAIRLFGQENVGKAIHDGVVAAFKRAEELGKN